MKATFLAAMAMLAVAGVAYDGIADRADGEGLLTGSAQASCVYDEITGTCHSTCIPPRQPLDWACPL